MKPAFRPVLLVLVVLAVMLALRGLRNARTPHDDLPWRKDLNTAKQEAAAARKPVLVYFTAEWCPPCQEMHRVTWPDPRVADALQAVVPVKIDVDQQADVAMAFNVESIPRMQLLNTDGTPGPTREGFTSVDELVAWLKSAN